ncbi:collagen alpha-1(III) chain-like [Oenanthe melanoleuca]|uniref:collagen alpha-1(III) chain-like n=1 Tax=Oenanthe melanoleuca TaxID=2939378 RepID=UPI0024C1FD68|nr:collagen alpha-1(III) chain-like [Oenanthe melanoleuca]
MGTTAARVLNSIANTNNVYVRRISGYLPCTPAARSTFVSKSASPVRYPVSDLFSTEFRKGATRRVRSGTGGSSPRRGRAERDPGRQHRSIWDRAQTKEGVEQLRGARQRRHASPLRSGGRKSISGRENPPTRAARCLPLAAEGRGASPRAPGTAGGTRRAQPRQREVTAAGGLKFGGEGQTPTRSTPPRLAAYLREGARCPQPSRRRERRSCAVPGRRGAPPLRRRLAQGVTGRRLPSPFPGTVLGERRAGAGMASGQERGRGGHCRPEEDARRPGAARPPAGGSARPAGGGLPLLAPRRRAGAIAALREPPRGSARRAAQGAWAGGGSAARNFPGSAAGCPGGARPRRRCEGGGRVRTPLSPPARALRSAPPGLGPHRPPAAKFHSETSRLRRHLHGSDPLASLRSPRDGAEAGRPLASRGDGRQPGPAQRALGRSGRRQHPGRDDSREKGQAEPRDRDAGPPLPPGPGEVCRLPGGERGPERPAPCFGSGRERLLCGTSPLPPPGSAGSACCAGPPRSLLPCGPSRAAVPQPRRSGAFVARPVPPRRARGRGREGGATAGAAGSAGCRPRCRGLGWVCRWESAFPGGGRSVPTVPRGAGALRVCPPSLTPCESRTEPWERRVIHRNVGAFHHFYDSAFHFYAYFGEFLLSRPPIPRVQPGTAKVIYLVLAPCSRAR